MKIAQSFSVARPLSAVWDLFQNIPEVAGCMPGAELIADKGGGVYAGRIAIRLGPFSAAFEGEAVVTTDEANHTGHVEGKGVDRRGGSRSKLVLDYKLAEAPGVTTVNIDADVQLSGPIAQFGRTGIINEAAAVLINQLVRNVEAKLAAPAPAAHGAEAASAAPLPRPEAVTPLSAGRVFWGVLRSYLRRLFGR